MLGSDAFDVEIWNELTFGSDFLDQGRYYDPCRASARPGRRDRARSSGARSRACATGATASRAIGIGDGFASQTPLPSGATSPPG